MSVPRVNENEEKDNEPKINNGRKAFLKKHLNIVFRRQNSTSIKELPKALKSEVEKLSRKDDPRTDSESVKSTTRRPRPLPAGTKPVKPLATRADEEFSSSKAKDTSIIDKSAETLYGSNESPNESVEVSNETREDLDKFVESDSSGTDIKVVDAKGGDTEVAEESINLKDDEISALNDKHTQATKKDISDLWQARDNTESENITKKISKEDKTSDISHSQDSAEKLPPSKKDMKSPSMPGVKIIKSYANYDSARVIAEASRIARENIKKGQDHVRGGQVNDQRGHRRTEKNKSLSFGQTESQRISDNKIKNLKNPNIGTGDGCKPETHPAKHFNKAAKIPLNTFSGGAHSRRGQSPLGPVKGEVQGKKKNTRSLASRTSRKDKYQEDFIEKNKTKSKSGAFIKPVPKQEQPEEEIKVIVIPKNLSIKDLATKLHMQSSAIVKKLFLQGKMVTPNTELSYEEAEEIAVEYDILCEKEVEEDVLKNLTEDIVDPDESLLPRNPVVCVMGHVDHGKTSLLDAIRHTNVTSREAGGITQHIGASVVKVGDRSITFLDTPGHEAFTSMRLRGAQSTDIAVLVVAADDGVKPQTLEAINHAKAAKVALIVAINKMDKEGADPELVKKELSDVGLIPEEWGGDTPVVEVSARTGKGIGDLLDMILLEADVLELKANPQRLARGLIIEARLDKGKGPVATTLIQKGSLKVGDYVVAGESFGRIRAMFDDKRNAIKNAAPSYPAEILGLNAVPTAGEILMAYNSEREARQVAEAFKAEHKKQMLDDTRKKMNLDDLFNEIKAGNIKELPVIIKADVQGSVEALRESLEKLNNGEVAVNVIHAAPGNINESDVSLAASSNAVIIGFNVKPDPQAKSSAETEKVDIRLYRVIYQVIDDLEKALSGMLIPTYEPMVTGHAVIRQIFKSSGVGNIAGCYVTDGVIERGTKARLYRGDKVLFDGDIASLKRYKDEVKEVKLGFECGIVLDEFSDIEVDDNLEIYKMVQVQGNSE